MQQAFVVGAGGAARRSPTVLAYAACAERRKEACEARVDVVGCDLGSVETGACSATPAGSVERPSRSGLGVRAG